jgi:hypothetical protein
MLMVNQLNGFGVGANVVVALTFTDHAVDASDAATYTFSSRAIGAAAGDRQVFVAVAGVNTGDVTSLTVAGISATKLVGQTFTGAATSNVEIWRADVPSGTTATIVVNTTTSGNRLGIGVYAATGALNTAFHSFTSGNNATNSGSINIPANGGCIGVAVTTSGGTSFTWTGLTEQYDENQESVSYQSGAMLAPGALGAHFLTRFF